MIKAKNNRKNKIRTQKTQTTIVTKVLPLLLLLILQKQLIITTIATTTVMTPLLMSKLPAALATKRSRVSKN